MGKDLNNRGTLALVLLLVGLILVEGTKVGFGGTTGYLPSSIDNIVQQRGFYFQPCEWMGMSGEDAIAAVGAPGMVQTFRGNAQILVEVASNDRAKPEPECFASITNRAPFEVTIEIGVTRYFLAANSTEWVNFRGLKAQLNYWECYLDECGWKQKEIESEYQYVIEAGGGGRLFIDRVMPEPENFGYFANCCSFEVTIEVDGTRYVLEAYSVEKIFYHGRKIRVKYWECPSGGCRWSEYTAFFRNCIFRITESEGGGLHIGFYSDIYKEEKMGTIPCPD
jgi:hypothetical protein